MSNKCKLDAWNYTEAAARKCGDSWERNNAHFPFNYLILCQSGCPNQMLLPHVRGQPLDPTQLLFPKLGLGLLQLSSAIRHVYENVAHPDWHRMFYRYAWPVRPALYAYCITRPTESIQIHILMWRPPMASWVGFNCGLRDLPRLHFGTVWEKRNLYPQKT